jgi:hypothetical protein
MEDGPEFKGEECNEGDYGDLIQAAYPHRPEAWNKYD